jgi:hypothetical protein
MIYDDSCLSFIDTNNADNKPLSIEEFNEQYNIADYIYNVSVIEKRGIKIRSANYSKKHHNFKEIEINGDEYTHITIMNDDIRKKLNNFVEKEQKKYYEILPS